MHVLHVQGVTLLAISAVAQWLECSSAKNKIVGFSLVCFGFAYLAEMEELLFVYKFCACLEV